MRKRLELLNILKKSQVRGSSDTGCLAIITLLGIIIIIVPIFRACQPEEPEVEVKFYSNVSDCVADQISQAQCQKAQDEAVLNHRTNQVSYPTEAECKNETQSSCEPITQNSATVYKPVMEGFLVEVQNFNNTNTSTGTHSRTTVFISQPVYGGYGSGYNRYRLADGEPLTVSRSREATKISTSRASSLKSPSVGRSVTKGFGSSFKASGRGASS